MDQEVKLSREQALFLYGEVMCDHVDDNEEEVFFRGTAPDGARVEFSLRFFDPLYRLSIHAGYNYRPNWGWSMIHISKDEQLLFSGLNDM